MPTSTFGQRCHKMVSAGHTTIGWNTEGDKFWVSNPERLAREDIPQYYGHSSYASWTRALHAHSFRKLTPSTWAHPNFHRDDPEAAALISRKRSSRTKPNMKVIALPEPATSSTMTNKDNGSSNSSDVQKVEAVDQKVEPSKEVQARLSVLREQIARERKTQNELNALLEKMNAETTRARREELQLRYMVVQIAQWISTAAATPGFAAATGLAAAGKVADIAGPAASKSFIALAGPESDSNSTIESVGDSDNEPAIADTTPDDIIALFEKALPFEKSPSKAPIQAPTKALAMLPPLPSLPPLTESCASAATSSCSSSMPSGPIMLTVGCGA